MAQPTIHYMIDTESWGLGPHAVLRQVAIVPFEISTRVIHTPHIFYPQQEEQLQRGRIKEAATVEWWQQQPEDLRLAIEAAEDCDTWQTVIARIQDLPITGTPSRIFCRNVAHDKPLLDSYFNTFNSAVPWRYDQWRDTYCYTDGFGVDVRNLAEGWQMLSRLEHTRHRIPQRKHEAASDCIQQVISLFAGLAVHGITEIY